MFRIIPEVQQDWTIMDIVNNQAYPLSWKPVFDKSLYELQVISDTLSDNPVYPSKDKIFHAYFKTPLHKVRVVILGQDPYHDDINGIPRAMGLAFSSPRGMNIPPSLINIFKELKREYPDFVIPKHGDLTSWTEQGVLLLNSSLTVIPHKPGSHRCLWKPFIINTIKEISRVNKKCVYLLWGNDAQSYTKYITGTILTAGHPSPINQRTPFIGCDHFKKVNELITPPIVWQI